MLRGISDIFSSQTVWDWLNFFQRSSMKLSQQKCENHEIVHFVSYFEYLCQILGIYWILLDFCVLVQARSALRDLRYFFSTNNLRLVKKFLEIIKEALIAKICKPGKSWFLSHILCILPILYTYLNVFLTFDVLVQARPALRDRRKIFSTNNLRLVQSFLEIFHESLTLKSSKYENH